MILCVCVQPWCSPLWLCVCVCVCACVLKAHRKLHFLTTHAQISHIHPSRHWSGNHRLFTGHCLCYLTTQKQTRNFLSLRRASLTEAQQTSLISLAFGSDRDSERERERRRERKTERGVREKEFERHRWGRAGGTDRARQLAYLFSINHFFTWFELTTVGETVCTFFFNLHQLHCTLFCHVFISIHCLWGHIRSIEQCQKY